MRKLLVRSSLALLVLALLSTAGFAKDYKKSWTIHEKVMVGQQVIEKGNYTVKFSDQNGELIILRDGKEVARAPYEIVTLAKPSQTDLSSYTSSPEGMKKLNRLEFNGLPFAISIKAN